MCLAGMHIVSNCGIQLRQMLSDFGMRLMLHSCAAVAYCHTGSAPQATSYAFAVQAAMCFDTSRALTGLKLSSGGSTILDAIAEGWAKRTTQLFVARLQYAEVLGKGPVSRVQESATKLACCLVFAERRVLRAHVQ